MKYWVMIAITVVFFGLLIVGQSMMKKEAKDNWNNGVCIECGGKYHLVSTAWSTVNETKYTYECEKCHHAFDSYDLLK